MAGQEKTLESPDLVLAEHPNWQVWMQKITACREAVSQLPLPENQSPIHSQEYQTHLESWRIFAQSCKDLEEVVVSEAPPKAKKS
jgi:hypothetical protein